ncbi:O-antigen polymerase [Leptolyngbya sp. NIES-3755]|nr:O-antigen polymerase [Leptolyngbya sp. NIES-3755]
MNRLDRFERGYAILVMLYFSGCLTNIMNGSILLPQESTPEINVIASPIVSAFQNLLFLILFGLIALRIKYFLPVVAKRKMLWVVVGIAIASVVWSEVPDLTFRRGNLLLFSTLLSLYFAMRFPLRQQLHMLAQTFGILAVSNFLFTLAFPSQGINRMAHAGAWMGITLHKNGLAGLMVLSAVIFFSIVIDKRERTLATFGGLAISVLLVILSTSRTGLSVMILLMVLTYAFQLLRSKSTFALPAFLAGFLTIGATIVLVVDNYERILTSMGRDATLTGRTTIWEVALERWTERPWFGYGYQSFWIPDQGNSLEVLYRMSWQPAHGHNGFLDLLVELGAVGFVAFAISLLIAFKRAIAWYKLNPNAIGTLPLISFCYVIMYNLTESSLLFTPNGINWFLYVLMSTSILIQAFPVMNASETVIEPEPLISM